MPHINRIRVNNVKYNFGTQAYDDFLMKPFCGNTLYDLANGGGKSVLMLLLLQNVIPNCTLDEKQPIEKLFRSGEGSKTIHSLIEWRLDDEDVKNGFRYMTTGFCARKASETEEESKETASIEYFNYCIFYRDYNGNDIRNLPLVKDKERITYSGLRRYLKELEKDASLIVKVFDRKGEYQAFLSEYGIYESEWEIIRGINKTEGHVRTYFETNYKTTRRVVEDLLIEEILGTSIRRKAGRDDAEDAMSKTLLDMKDKLVELAKQKDAIKSFDREEEVLNEFSSRVAYLGSIYKEQGDLLIDLNRIYNSADFYMESRRQAAEEQKALQEAANAELRGFEAELLAAAISEDREKALSYKAETEQFVAESAQKKNRVEALSALLVKKECANDYLGYLEEKQKRDETAVTLQAMTEKSGLHKELAALVNEFALKKEQREEELSEQLTRCEAEEQAAAARRKTSETAQRDVERELSVTKVLSEQTRKELSAVYGRLKEKKDAQGLLLTEDAPMRLYKKGEQKKHAEAKRAELRAEAAQGEKLREEIATKLVNAQKALDRYREEALAQSKAEERLAEDKVRADKLAEAYGEKDYRALRENVRGRCREAYFDRAAAQKAADEAKRRRQEIEAGNYLCSNEAAKSVKEYIITRYQKLAMTGDEYLADKTEEEKKELLASVPGLSYAVITEGFAEAAEDHLLSECIPEGVVVPVIRIESIRGHKELFHKEQLLLFAKDGAALLEEKERNRELVRLGRIEEEETHRINRLNSLLSAYEEDEEFLTAFVAAYYSTMYAKKTEYGTEEDTEAKLAAEVAELGEQKKKLGERLAELPELEEACLSEIAACDEEVRAFREINELAKLANEKEKQIHEYDEKQKHLTEWKEEAQKLHEQAELAYMEKKAAKESLGRQYNELVHAMESYQVYADDVEASQSGLTVEELRVQIDGKIAALHTEASSLEDKQRLLDSYVNSMNRMLRNIRSKGMSIAELAELDARNEIYETSEEELLSRREEIRTLTAEAENIEKKIRDLREKQYRLEGKNSQAEAAITEKYGEYKPVELTGDELAAFLTKRRQQIEQKKAELSELVKEQEKLMAELGSYQEMKTEIERMFPDAKALTEEVGRLENNVRLKEVYEEKRDKFNGIAGELLRRQDEFYRNRQTTMETLNLLGAGVLATEISGSVTMPKNLRETEDIVRGMKEVIECLQLERTRIEAGLGDLETIKESFEEQCLQRCINIKADLERLPKLSKISLDGEQIPMISLQIPYVKEEFFKERMTQYIDSVVKEVDAIAGQQERMKYIKSALSYKKLFAVIVTDMNAIKLMLYKRERVKEQSRMLRYEEAVGSTGQSQGIYIQFLIAVINYISSIYSPKGDATRLRKVIFIDNPFGAAKDVYIWEPIFELLRANHVQMIVPARGTTPAITGRFDVNYVLGQKLIDGRQQTVVVDYCSRIEADSVEYIPLQYEQTSLDLMLSTES